METAIRNKNTKGFTLVELIVVIAVMLILVVLAVIGITGIIQNAASASRAADARTIATAVNLFNTMVDETSSGSTPNAAINTVANLEDAFAGNRLVLTLGSPFNMDVSVTVNGGAARIDDLVDIDGDDEDYLQFTPAADGVPAFWFARGDQGGDQE